MSETLSPDRLPSEKHLRKKCLELQNKPYLPPELLAIVTHIASLQTAAMPSVHFLKRTALKLPRAVLKRLPPADARTRGAVMLPREAFPLDLALAAKLIPKFLAAVQAQAPHLAAAARSLETALREDDTLLPKTAREIPRLFSGDQKDEKQTPLVFAWRRNHPEAPELLRFVVQSSLMPSLCIAGLLLGAHHDGSLPWRHGHCPVCGSLPLMGNLAGSEGARSHACSFCGFVYRVPRIGCPFCLDDSPKSGEYFTSEDETGFQLEVCRSCNTYIKLADFRSYDRRWLPQLDDLSSLTLDLYARQMGFMRPSLSAWGF